MRSLFAFFSLVLMVAVPPVVAQSALWQAFPSLRNVQTLSSSEEALWVGTDGGVYRYDVGSGEIERYTSVEGLSGVDARAIAYDARRSAVWIGYPDGVFDRLDVESGAVETFVDIARADRFTSRNINRIEVEGDSLWISTGFGLVIFDTVAQEVRDTYERFGAFPSGVATFDALRAPTPDGAPGLWVGTREGVAYAPLSAPNLREPSAWTNGPDEVRNVLSLAFFQNEIYAGTELITEFISGTTVILEEGGVWKRDAAATWSRLPYGTESINDLIVDSDRLLISSIFKLTVRAIDGSAVRYDIPDAFSFNAATLGPQGRVWVGETLRGVLGFPDLSSVPPGAVDPEVQVIPDGPSTNQVLIVGAAGGQGVWVGFSSDQDGIAPFAQFDGTQWVNYSVANGAVDARAQVLGITQDDDGNVWLGSRGRGVYQVSPEGVVTRYTVGNSSLAESGGFENYVESYGLAIDDEDRLWVTNRLASPPLHVRASDGEWTGLRPPASVPSSVTFRGLTIDTFGYKWLSTDPTGTSGASGLVVLDTAGTPLDDSDDRAVYISGSPAVGSGLPNDEVNAFAEDRSGRMWIGTDRGLAIVFSPGSIFSGDPAAQITWARNAEGTEFLLRDLKIFDIAVDPADRKWIASSSGAWLLNADGDEVLFNLTAENSPLPSDQILSVEVDEETGAVYFATSGGVYRYQGDAIAAVREAENLFIYPNPVRSTGGALPTIAITGLVDEASVRVLTVDGQVVAAFETRGGSITWDGRDQRTGTFVPSGVYLVAADGDDGTAYGKIAVIR